ncbi:MAG: type II CAAX prenyl endopeptidase Rce1 family protein [Oligoflexus sp.]
MQIKPPQLQGIAWLQGLAYFFLLALILKLSYVLLGTWLAELKSWQVAAIIHGLIAAFIVFKTPAPWGIRGLFQEAGIYLALSLIGMSIIAVWWSAGWQGLSRAFFWHWQDSLVLLLIPIIEELVFRFGLGNLLKRILGSFWGGYFSILLFAWVHILASAPSELSNYLILPLGPLLLGLTCEVLWQRSQKILVPILLHIAANMTALIFHYGDPSWLTKLGSFYLAS